SDRDRAVLDASRALDEATRGGDAAKIRAAMAALEQALREKADAAPAPSAAPAAAAGEAPAAAATDGESAAATRADTPAPAPKAPPKPVVAMRGDDRPGARRPEPAAPARGGRFDARRGAPGGRDARGRGDERRPPPGAGREDRGPRLGVAAFRAPRDAAEPAQAALRKPASQAHGEALTQLMAAWEHRNADEVPGVQELGRAVAPAARGAWLQALGKPAAGDAAEALLR